MRPLAVGFTILAYCWLIAGLLLTGCVSSHPVNKVQPVREDFSKHSDLQLCIIKIHYERDELNVNPSYYPEHNYDLKRYNAISSEIDQRNTTKVVAYCDKLISKDLTDNLTSEKMKKLELTPRQKKARALATCHALGGSQCNQDYEY